MTTNLTFDSIKNQYIYALYDSIKAFAYRKNVPSENIFTAYGSVSEGVTQYLCCNTICKWYSSVYKQMVLKCKSYDDIYTEPTLENDEEDETGNALLYNFPNTISLRNPITKRLINGGYATTEFKIFLYSRDDNDTTEKLSIADTNLDFKKIASYVKGNDFNKVYERAKEYSAKADPSVSATIYEILLNPEKITSIDIDWGSSKYSITLYILLKDYDADRNKALSSAKTHSLIIKMKIHMYIQYYTKSTSATKVDIVSEYLRSHNLSKYCMMK